MSTIRTRQERLQELEKERDLYSKHQSTPSSTSALQGSYQNLTLNSPNVNNNSNDFCFSKGANFSNKFRYNEKTGIQQFSATSGGETFLDESDYFLPQKMSTPSPIVTKKKEKSTQISHHQQPTSSSSQKRTIVDPWTKLIQKEEKSRIKYHGSDKTLIVLLEEERIKHLQLEQEYQNLLSHVHQLQQTHKREMTQISNESFQQKESFHGRLEKREEELARLRGDLEGIVRKYEQLRREKEGDGERSDEQIGRFRKLFLESEAQCLSMEKTVESIEKTNKTLLQDFESKDLELKRLELRLKEKEVEKIKEGEQKMKFEVQTLQLDHQLSIKEEELKNLKTLVQKFKFDAEEHERLKKTFDEFKVDFENVKSREKNLVYENQQFSLNESKILKEFEECQNKLRKYQHEFERVKAIESLQKQDIDRFKNEYLKLQNEATGLKNQVLQVSEDLKKQNSYNSSLNSQIENQKTNNNDLKNLIVSREKELAISKCAEEQTRKEKDDLLVNKGQLEQSLNRKRDEVSQLEKHLQDVGDRLESELKMKLESKQQNFQRLNALQEVVNDLSLKSEESQQELVEYRDLELQLKHQLKKSDESNQRLEKAKNEVEDELEKERFLSLSLQKEKEQIRQQGRKEILLAQDKFSECIKISKNSINILVIESMEVELKQQKSQLIQKINQNNLLQEEYSHLKYEFEDLQSTHFKTNAKNTDLSAQQKNADRQIQTLQQQLQSREQGFSVLQVKHNSLTENYKRMEEELDIIKNDGDKKDVEVGRLKSNVNELRRLRGQVDLLLQGKSGSQSALNILPTKKNLEYLARDVGDHSPQQQQFQSTRELNSALNSPTTGRKNSVNNTKIEGIDEEEVGSSKSPRANFEQFYSSNSSRNFERLKN